VAPCENITVTNCTMHAGHGGVVIGSEMSGGVRNVVISNCVFVGTDRGIRFKSRRGRGGVVEDVRINNIIMQDVACPISMNLYYACGAWGDPVVADKSPRPLEDSTPHFRRIHFSNISARNVRFAAAFLYGLGEAPLEDISFTDVSVSLALEAEGGYPDMADGLTIMQRAGFWISNVRGLRLQNVEVENQLGAALLVENAAEVEVAGFKNRTPSRSAPVIDLRDVAQGLLHGCQANRQTDIFIRLSGARTADIVLSGNHMFSARMPVSMAVEVPPEEVMLM
jgi:polygalacturonase